MRDSKTLFLMIFALALVTVSFVLISIWGYHYYFQNKAEKPIAAIKKSPEQKRTSPVDTLQSLKDSGTASVDLAETNLDKVSDSADQTLELKISEYNQLKKEVAEMLKNKEALKNRMDEMKKIGEIQKNIDSLKAQKEAITKENERMDQLLQENQPEQSNNKTDIKNNDKNLPRPSLTLLVSHLKFDAIREADTYEAPTVLASKASKFEGSFEISIVSKKNISSDIFVKILQPNGRPVLDASSGLAILEKNQEKSSYSLVLHFDKAKDNHKRLKFSVNPKEFYKGKYTMQIYHNGVMIGRTQRTLN